MQNDTLSALKKKNHKLQPEEQVVNHHNYQYAYVKKDYLRRTRQYYQTSGDVHQRQFPFSFTPVEFRKRIFAWFIT